MKIDFLRKIEENFHQIVKTLIPRGQVVRKKLVHFNAHTCVPKTGQLSMTGQKIIHKVDQSQTALILNGLCLAARARLVGKSIFKFQTKL
jgi:flagellar biosynthesis/type III secretory pathway chaperone